jgi:hypothetical protein
MSRRNFDPDHILRRERERRYRHGPTAVIEHHENRNEGELDEDLRFI